MAERTRRRHDAIGRRLGRRDGRAGRSADRHDGRARQAAKPAQIFEDFAQPAPQRRTRRNDIDMILDIPVQLTVELGRTKIPIKQPAAAGAGLGGRTRRPGRRTDGRAGQRLPDRAGRGRGGQRQVRHPPDRHHHAVGAHAQTRTADLRRRRPLAAMRARHRRCWFAAAAAADSGTGAAAPRHDLGRSLQATLGLAIVLALIWRRRVGRPPPDARRPRSGSSAIKVVASQQRGSARARGAGRGRRHLARPRRRARPASTPCTRCPKAVLRRERHAGQSLRAHARPGERRPPVPDSQRSATRPFAADSGARRGRGARARSRRRECAGRRLARDDQHAGRRRQPDLLAVDPDAAAASRR